jgi:hypothetical protein
VREVAVAFEPRERSATSLKNFRYHVDERCGVDASDACSKYRLPTNQTGA